MDFVSIFFFFGSFVLLQLCYQDIRYRLVKTDLSHYMMGATGVIFLGLDLVWVWVGFMLLVIFGLSFLKRVKFLTAHIRDGDITVLGWICPSLIVLGVSYFVAWLFLYCIGNVFLAILSKKKEMAGITPMFVAFILTATMWTFHII